MAEINRRAFVAGSLAMAATIACSAAAATAVKPEAYLGMDMRPPRFFFELADGSEQTLTLDELRRAPWLRECQPDTREALTGWIDYFDRRHASTWST